MRILHLTALMAVFLCIPLKQGFYKNAYAKDIQKQEGYVLTGPDGETILSKNPHTPLIPASTIKVLTGMCAIHYLSEKHSFKTVFFLDKKSRLKVKGYGDPLLISEEIQKIASKVAEKLKQLHNISTLTSIIIDNTFFDSNIKIPGTGNSDNPYDAPLGAFCANFNTVSFQFSRKDNRFVSDEPQTPLLPYLHKYVAASKKSKGRIILNENESKAYAGNLLKYFLEKNGIKVKGKTGFGKIGSEDTHVLTWNSSYELKDIIQKMLKYSSNFIANQLTLTIGADVFSPPATLQKGVMALTDYAEKIINIKDLTLNEGSGLSRQNRVSPASMIKILQAFKKYHNLMRKKGNEFYKTGTLNGVRTRCGYFYTDRGMYPFAVMVNAPGRGYESIIIKMRKAVRQAAKNIKVL